MASNCPICLKVKYLFLRKTAKKRNDKNNLAKATKLASRPARLPFINPKEKAQISETTIK